MGRQTIIVMALGIVACHSPQPERHGTDTSLPRTTIKAMAPHANESVGTRADWQDSTCDVDTIRAHVDPRELVREYVTRNDFLGFFAGGGAANDDWLLSAAECPGHLGGTDGAVVVGAATIEELGVGADTAAFVVRYAVIGSTTPSLPDERHMRFLPMATELRDSIRLVRTPYGWRISGQPENPFMGPAAVLRHANLDSVSIRALDSVRQATNVPRPGA